MLAISMSSEAKSESPNFSSLNILVNENYKM
jgi:hypothetical protein